MKAILFAFLFLPSFNALAINAESSWEDIFFHRATVENPYQDGMGTIKFYNACVTLTEVRSIRDVNVCTRMIPIERGGTGMGEDTRYTDWQCASYETKALTMPRTYERTVCEAMSAGGEASPQCLRYGKKTVKIPLDIDLHIWQDMGEVSNFPGFTKWFELPWCAEAE